uniref:Interphotoreceptor retinoid-binding protein like n=1 Tax=Nothobranchius furzeri TaxID=105023 RepID=A0A8C6P047_NOTFU
MPPIMSSLPKEQLILLVRNSFRVDILENNTGYLRIDWIFGDKTVTMVAAVLQDNIWNQIAQTSSLIFDLRYSAAGELSGVPFVISYIMDPEPLIHIDTIYDRPSNTTRELWTITLAYLVQSLNCGTVIGEITSGKLMHSKTFQIEKTAIAITIPFINFIDNNGEFWLKGGVVPEAIVLAEEAMDHVHEIVKFHIGIGSIIEAVGELLEKYYAIQEVALNVSQRLLSKHTKGLYYLTADLGESSGDHHLHVFYCDVEPESFYNVPNIPTVEEAGYMTDALFKTELFPGNIDSLVIDMRYNTGGYWSAIPLLCTHFFDAKPLQHLYTILDRTTNTLTEVTTSSHIKGQRYGSSKNLYILISYTTGPAAEVFVLRGLQSTLHYSVSFILSHTHSHPGDIVATAALGHTDRGVACHKQAPPVPPTTTSMQDGLCVLPNDTTVEFFGRSRDGTCNLLITGQRALPPELLLPYIHK